MVLVLVGVVTFVVTEVVFGVVALLGPTIVAWPLAVLRHFLTFLVVVLVFFVTPFVAFVVGPREQESFLCPYRGN